MQRFLLFLCVVLVSTSFVSCISYTRFEKDVHTITESDTTVAERVTNQPGDRDNGVIYPSSRTVTVSRKMVQRDSVVERAYPNFIRLGLFEGVGLIGSATDGAHSTNTGLFGLFHDIDETFFNVKKDTTASRLFAGEIYRMGIAEWRLHWFDEAPGWSWGVTALEFIIPDDLTRHNLTGAGVLSIRKRFYIKNTIPYAAITPFFSVAFAPSTYAHTGVSADLGSIGGLNLRLYGGVVLGVPVTMVFKNRVLFPYLGVGISVFDFLNKEEELNVEWKYHEHSAWDLSIAELIIAGANVDDPVFIRKDTSAPSLILTGFLARAVSASIALPLLDYRLTLGTSLGSFIGLGLNEFALGILPLRASYIWHPFETDLVVEPFFEVAFAPSSFVHLGFRGQITLAEQVSLIIQGGYVNGGTGSLAGFNLNQDRVRGNNPTQFSAIYLGFGAAFFDRMFSRKDLRYGKGYPHE